MQTHQKELMGALAAITSAILFGTMPFMAKYAFRLGSNAFTVSFGRFLTGAVLSFLLLLLLPEQSPRISPEQLRSLLLLSFFYAATPVLLYSSYQSIDSGLASTLHFTYPVAVVLLSALLLHEKIGRKERLCTVLCMCGMILLYKPETQVNGSGMVIAVLSGFVYGGYIMLLGRSSLQAVPVLTLTFWLSILSATEILVFSLLTGKLLLNLPSAVWVSYLGLGLFATVLALALFQIGVFLCGAVKASLLSTFEPLTGVMIGILFFHEIHTGRSFLGIILILSAVIVLVMPDPFSSTNSSKNRNL